MSYPKEFTDVTLKPIIDWETGGKNYYEQKYKCHPVWPQGASGVTIGCGYDLGYYSKEEIQKTWAPYVKQQDLTKLLKTAGLKGALAQQALPQVKSVIVDWQSSLKVFFDVTVEKFWNYTVRTFPGVEELCTSAQIAMLSLVFNRGTSLKKEDRRKEMIALVPLVQKKDYKGMAKQFRSMKRLWSNGLVQRREDEAKLIEKCLS
jgi:hypothetical protein